MKHLDRLQDTLKGLKYKIDKFCDYGLKTLTTLTDAEGGDSQAFEKFYKAPESTPNKKISHGIIVWKSVLDQTSTDLEIDELLNKLRGECMGILALKHDLLVVVPVH